MTDGEDKWSWSRVLVIAQLLVMFFALIGGGLGFYQGVVAKTLAETEVTEHDITASSHYAWREQIRVRVDKHDVKMERLTTLVGQSVVEWRKDQEETLRILRKTRGDDEIR